MTKQKLIGIIKRLLNTEEDISFLFKLTESELESLVALIRDRVDRQER